jgi:hypothetical protein
MAPSDLPGLFTPDDQALSSPAACAMQKQVDRKFALTEGMLKDKLQEIKGAVIICYPMGLPQFDPMRMILDGQDGGPAAVRSKHPAFYSCHFCFHS